MDTTKANILDAAEELFLRIGPAKANMTQVARASGLSRQSVYAYFENKDALIAEVTGQIMGKILAQLRLSWATCGKLEEKLDVFFQLNVVDPFLILQTHPELQVLLQGGSERTTEVVKQAEQEIVRALEAQIEPHCGNLPTSISFSELAEYIAGVSKGIKYSTSSQDELVRHLHLLKSSIVALVGLQSGVGPESI